MGTRAPCRSGKLLRSWSFPCFLCLVLPSLVFFYIAYHDVSHSRLRVPKHYTTNPPQNHLQNPTQIPLQNPTQNPTKSRLENPTQNPTKNRLQNPTQNPTKNRLENRTQNPTQNPTQKHLQNPTQKRPHKCTPTAYTFCNTTHPETERVKFEHLARQERLAGKSGPAWRPFVVDLPENSTQRIRATSDYGRDGFIRIATAQRPSHIPKEIFKFDQCEVKTCKYVGDILTKEVDAVLVHGPEMRGVETPQRWPHQVYIYASWESPYTTNDLAWKPDNPWNYAFNLTLTYNIHADVFSPYSYLLHNETTRDTVDFDAIARNKDKMVIWKVSHCDTQSKREKYVEELKKHIQVDVFGKCGTPCPKDPDLCEREIQRYRFVIGFDNSFCDDYFTEKYYRRIRWEEEGLVPILRGRFNYSRNFPPKTFIDTADFDNPKDLADYLKMLSENPHVYAEYVEALYQYKLYKPSFWGPHFACDLCKRLHEMDMTKSRYYHISRWLTKEHCVKPVDL